MSQTPVTSDPKAATVDPAGVPDLTYIEWVVQQIKESKWYVGDGGFVAQAMGAQTLEEATATGDLIPGREREGDVFRFSSATFADSDLDGQLPFYAVCDVIDPTTGQLAKWACGGARVVATLFRACQMDWFPFDASVISVDMGMGKRALNMVLAPTKVTSKKL
jgi:hypothetical protein